MKQGKIYCLKDPFNLEVRYIGFTRNSLNVRFSQHKHEALVKNSLSRCYNWFRLCSNKGKLPIIELLEENIPVENWTDRESFWINTHKNLTNQKEGGCGIHLNTKSSGRNRSIDSKKIPIIQITKENVFVKEWGSIIEAEKELLGKYTGNLFRAVKTKSTALNYFWVKKEDYIKNNNYSFIGKHWTKIYLFCVYTKKLIKIYEKASDLSKEFNCNPSIINQALDKNLIFKTMYYISKIENPNKFPKPNPVYWYNNKYYTSFRSLYKTEKLPFSEVWQKQKNLNKYLITEISEDIVRTLRETSR